MADNDGKETGDGDGDSDFDARLDALKQSRAERLGKHRSHGDAPEAPKTGMQGVGYGLRIGTEMVAALLIGLAIGYGLDQWLGTKPWFMIVFLFFGMAAGVSNVYRLATGMDAGVGWHRPGDTTETSKTRGQDNVRKEKGEE